MARHVDKMDGIAEQLKAIGTILKESLDIGIFLASVDVIGLQPATAAIKTVAEAEMTWEDVTSRLIKEVKHFAATTSLVRSLPQRHSGGVPYAARRDTTSLRVF